MKKSIKEIIVVEGRDDISAVKAAVDAEVIQVNGFAVRKQGTIEKIKVADQNRGIQIMLEKKLENIYINFFQRQKMPILEE